jgi:uncharacterized protein YciI
MTENWKRLRVAAALAGTFCAGGMAARSLAARPQNVLPGAQNPNIPTNMKQYYVAFLTRSDKWKEGESDAVVGPLAGKHLEFVRLQSEKGNFALAGPFLDRGRILGMAVVRADSPEDAHTILDGDPFMPTGLVQAEIHPAYLEDLSGVKFEYPAAATK